jgi:hypothetical protein
MQKKVHKYSPTPPLVGGFRSHEPRTSYEECGTWTYPDMLSLSYCRSGHSGNSETLEITIKSCNGAYAGETWDEKVKLTVLGTIEIEQLAQSLRALADKLTHQQ